eukprot:jgi/Psemu1/14126/gm1.14126_g
MPVDRWHTQWGQCLSQGLRKRWNKIIADRVLDHSREGFKTTVRGAYINAIIPDPDAKGTMIEAFEHYHTAKPREVSERAHFNRIDTILDHINMLPRDNNHDLTEQQRKRMFFKTHPKSWQDSYMDTAVNFRELTKRREERTMERLVGRKEATNEKTSNKKETVKENKASDVKETTGEKIAMVNANTEKGPRGIRTGITFGSSATSIQGTDSRRRTHNTSVLTTPIQGILLTQTNDLADDLVEVEVLEPEEDPTRMITADDPEAKAMEPAQGEDLYSMKTTIINGGDITIVIMKELLCCLTIGIQYKLQ